MFRPKTEIMSSICSEFVQNAWKKDLCSNCFKAKADHITSQTVTVGKESFLVQGDGGPPINERQTSQILISTVDSTKMNLEINNGISPASPFKAAGLSASGCSHNKSHSTIITSNNNNVDDVVIANNQLNSCGNPRFIKNKSSSTLNGNGHPSLRKIGSSGVHLWEVGHLPEKHSLAESTPVLNGVKDETECKAEQDSTPSFNGTTSVENDHKSVPGILKEKSGLANGSSKGRLHFGIGSERRGSVGFINESPLVIGYGGNDYEWDDQDSVEDEPSDLDSLEESFEMSEEDRAFCQLTDRNTEYNSDNTNLLTTLEHRSEHHSLPDGKLKPVPNGRIFHRVRSEVDLKLNKHLPEETETPSDVIKKSGRPSLIESDETRFDYLENDEAGLQCEDNLNDGAVTEETMHSSFTKDNGEDKMHNTVASLGASANVAVYRPGSETVPSRKYPSTPRASVMRLFSEEPVTSAEFKAAIDSTQPLTLSRGEQDVLGGRVDTSNGPSFIDEKPDTSGREDFHCLPNANRHHVVDNHDGSECSPYDVVPLSSLKREKDCSDKTYCSSQAPTIPLCPPPSANDDSQKFPLSTKLIKPPGNTFGLMSNRFQSHVAISKQNSGPEQASPPKNYSSSGRGEPKSTVGVCSTFCSPAKNDSTDPRFWNREYASVNYSCHYAASYISTGVNPSTLPSDGVSGKIGGAALSDLPPTPLTNPYSSTAILKGIPQQRDASVEQSPQKPPVTKPKPKLPLKPVGQPKSFDDCISLVRDSDSGGEKNARSDDASVGASLHDTKGAHFQALTGDNNDAAGETIVANTSESSLCYPEISDSNELQMSVTSEEALASECDTVEQQKCLSTFESKVATLSSSLDFSKRTPKRQAPRPPTGTQESPSQFTKNDRSSTGVPDDHADHHLLVSAHKVASSMSMDRCASSSKVYNDIGTPHTFDRRSSPSNRTVPNADSGLPHNQGSSHVGSSALTSTYALNGAPYDSSQRIHSKEVSHKEGKLKKSKFSLKKLWKFGTKDDGEDSSKLKGKILHFGNSQQQERRGKLEILHPIDLINASTTQPNELSNVTPTPGLSVDRRSEVSMTSSLNGRDEMSTSTGVGTIQRAFPKEEVSFGLF